MKFAAASTAVLINRQGSPLEGAIWWAIETGFDNSAADPVFTARIASQGCAFQHCVQEASLSLHQSPARGKVRAYGEKLYLNAATIIPLVALPDPSKAPSTVGTAQEVRLEIENRPAVTVMQLQNAVFFSFFASAGSFCNTGTVSWPSSEFFLGCSSQALAMASWVAPANCHAAIASLRHIHNRYPHGLAGIWSNL